MAASSAIEWTNATWNPITGCSKVARGCAHCYAEQFAEHWRGIPGHPHEQGFDLRLRVPWNNSSNCARAGATMPCSVTITGDRSVDEAIILRSVELAIACVAKGSPH